MGCSQDIQAPVVPLGIESHGSQDTKYPEIPRTLPGSPTRHGVPIDPKILSILGYPGQSQVVPPTPCMVWQDMRKNNIRESVNSLCRNGADAQYMQ